MLRLNLDVSWTMFIGVSTLTFNLMDFSFISQIQNIFNIPHPFRMFLADVCLTVSAQLWIWSPLVVLKFQCVFVFDSSHLVFQYDLLPYDCYPWHRIAKFSDLTNLSHTTLSAFHPVSPLSRGAPQPGPPQPPDSCFHLQSSASDPRPPISSLLSSRKPGARDPGFLSNQKTWAWIWESDNLEPDLWFTMQV